MKVNALIALVLLVLVVYPLALAIQIVIDTRWGDAAFLEALTQGDKGDVAMLMLQDWQLALTPIAVVFAAFIVSRLLGRQLPALKWLFPLLVIVSLISPFVPYMPLLGGIALALSALLFVIWSRGAWS